MADRRADVLARHRAGAEGRDTCRALTASMDETIRAAWNGIGQGRETHAAVLALGGFGRGELSPFSDVDVMILCDSGDARGLAEETAKSLLRVLWDAGIDIGHSVRTIDEAVGLNGVSIDAWAAMLEARFICGNEPLAERFFRDIRSRVSTGPEEWFVKGVLAERDARHRRYGNSVKLLEPNIKQSAGGLRDLHTVFWLYRGTDPDFLSGLEPQNSGTEQFLQLLHTKGIVPHEEYPALIQALGFLLRTRHEMHFLRESLHDTVEYDLQLRVADSLRFLPGNGSTGVEVFMRLYYLHARTIDRFSKRICREFRARVETTKRTDTPEPAGGNFLLSRDTLTVSPAVTSFSDTTEIFEAFALAAEHEVEMDHRLHGLIERGIRLIDSRAQTSPEIASLFRRILRSHRVGETLLQMNELDVLGRYIPEFGDLVAFFQHNVYHYFTADEHTLIAVSNAESLREQEGILHDVFRSIRGKEILFLAILLHDIAKPRGVADHEIAGVEIADVILRRLGITDALPLVAFLIRNHLVMEQIAFRRNIHDPATIREFASLFETAEQLDYLYLLTYADLSAVNMNVWTDWKASILRDLYLQTSEILRRKLTGKQIEEYHQSKRQEAVEQVIHRLSGEIPDTAIRRHLDGIPNQAYVSLFSDEEIAHHIREGGSDGPLSVSFRHSEGFTEVTVVASDAPFALSHCCAVLSANDANIFDATIVTRDDGVIIDRFRVSDSSTRQQLDYGVCDKIREDVRSVFDGTVDIEQLFSSHRRRWKRRRGHPVNPTTRIDVEFQANPRFTIIDVYAPDSLGFLYRVTETMGRIGLDIHFAKIATRIDGVVDAFYVLDRDGKPITASGRMDEVKNELMTTIRMIVEEELTGEA